MARKVEKLTALRVESLKEKPGLHADGAGLYLQVKGGGASWLLRYQLNGRARWMGLGPLALYGLKDARTKSLDARKLKHEGTDPVEMKRRSRAKQKLEAAKAIKFKDAAAQYISSHRKGWRNAKHAEQWTNTLATYADPEIGSLPVQAIDTTLVLKVLEPIWSEKPETASRLRGRIESVLDWAKARGYREGENPARWRGHLDKLLPARGKVRKIEHHAALSYLEMPAFIAALRAQDGTAAQALEFAILTAARTGEVIGARWREIDLTQKLWAVPAARMKAGKEHRVPLSAAATKILGSLQPEQDEPDGNVFRGGRGGKPLSNMAMLMTLRRMKRGDLTAHGFRSTFRDWVSERTNFPREVAEMALAHTVSDKVEAAYRRGDLFERRRKLMSQWADFCGQPASAATAVVVPMRARA
jgi:integrase